jgi:hypothetical protein
MSTTQSTDVEFWSIALIQVDITWPPTYSTGLKNIETLFPPWQFFDSFFKLLVPNFWGRFEALNDIFWGFGAQGRLPKAHLPLAMGQSKIILLG